MPASIQSSIAGNPACGTSASVHLAGADGIRSLACLWVIFGHIFMYLPSAFQVTAYPWRVVYRGYLGVAMFFVLSGFLLSQPFWKAFLAGAPMPSLRVYWSRRLARIIPGFWLCVVITAAAAGMLGTRWELVALALTLSFTNSLFAATYLPAFNRPLWSISVEMWFYLFLPLTMMAVFRRGTIGGAIGLIVALMILLAAAQALFLHLAPSIEAAVNEPAFFSAAETSWATYQNPPAMFAHFLVGVLAGWALLALARTRRAPQPDKANWCDAGCLLVFIVLAVGMSGEERPVIPWLAYMRYDWPVFNLLIGSLLVMLPLSRYVGAWLDNRFFRVTALLSFGLYMWHVPILGWCKRLWPVPADASPWQAATFALVAILASYLVATASYLCIERPALAWARRRETRVQSQPTLAR